ncbi:caspase-1-like [Anopheles cruzii]|uniref:caspase-1-like n=1 Tax=Anopheles cruzii TaxID=68878 RepID=UPI0022EC4C40|nr:caspase-1-like [Anopheles cruzii]
MDHDATDSELYSPPSDSSAASEPKLFVTSPPTDPEYKMDHQNRGVAIVLNHTTFEDHLNLPARDGSEDQKAIHDALERLRFKVTSLDNRTEAELFEKLEEVAKMDHTYNDCLVVVVLTHGGNGKLYAKDGAYTAERLWKTFVGKACPTLIVKPKLFFIQTCRGYPKDYNASAPPKDPAADAVDSQDSSATRQYTIPTMSNLLVGYSTNDSKDSWRSPHAGSQYVRLLATNLDEYGHKMDLLNLLALVANQVDRDQPTGDRKKPKQIPYTVSTLTKDLFFPKK